MGAKERWLEAMWPRVRSWLPDPPAVVVELGCGSLGGFVPAMLAESYTAIGIDPAAPEDDAYRRVEFERSELPPDVDALVASVSLHHVADPADVLARTARALKPGGRVVVLEWDWESFDEQTARWCFARLDADADAGADGDGWLSRTREHWLASGLPWDEYLRHSAGGHGLHSARALVRGLDERFERLHCERGAYLFPELPCTTEAEELEAIAAGEVRPLRIDYVARRPPIAR
jgi:SAM-dependent methyltransferase